MSPNIPHADPQIHVFGEVLLDCFPDGRRVLGGAPFNVAWNLQAFGLKPQFISRIGNDLDGREIVTLMTDWGMSLDSLQTDMTYPTGLVCVEIHDGEPHYNIVPDSAYDFIDENLLPRIKTNLETKETKNILYHGSLGIRNPISLKALQTFKTNHHGKIFVDVNLRDPWWRKETLFPLLNDADFVKINEQELAILHPEVYPESSEIEARIKGFYQQFDLDIIIVTLGEKGAIVWDNQQFTRVQPSTTIKVVDTVGAGDAFASVFLLGLSKQWTIENILEKAQAFAEKIIMRQGATTTNQDFYQSFKQRSFQAQPDG